MTCDELPSFKNSIPANDDGKEKEAVDIYFEKNVNPKDVDKSVSSLPYAIQFPNDPAFISNTTMSPELFAQVALQPPCQPALFDLKNHKFPTKKQGKYTRSFHEGHYFKKLRLANSLKGLGYHIYLQLIEYIV
ncbi:zinc finger MYM-type protein 1-like [Aphis craccivora]|uniref:Zinc finger MYM-type protein 1-like n=1 Tax=Aphis craccivora TaxID=307492 RepID=A0A6G0VWZ4_APHCR|nr:zinc finger MYM-type protein 1-like [Aphis craccivora]